MFWSLCANVTKQIYIYVETWRNPAISYIQGVITGSRPYLNMSSPSRPCVGFIRTNDFNVFDLITSFCYKHNIDYHTDFSWADSPRDRYHKVYFCTFAEALKVLGFTSNLNCEVVYVNNTRRFNLMVDIDGE